MQGLLLLHLIFFLSMSTWAAKDYSHLMPGPQHGVSSCPRYCFDLDEEDVEIGVEDVFAPLGFDEEDQWPEATLTGWLPSTCYRKPRAEIRREGNILKISVIATQNLSPNRICLKMAIPFFVSASLGKLEQGDYTLYLTKRTGLIRETSMKIAQSRSALVDDYVYALVERVEVDAANNKAILSGHNPSNCVELDRIEIISNRHNTYSILPIMKQVKPDCPRWSVPFNYTFDLPQALTAPKILLHVRSLEGKAVNFVFNSR